MRKGFVAVLAAATALVTLPMHAAHAVSPTDGEVTGTIVSAANGKPVKGACFTLWTDQGIFTFGADPSGNYDAVNLPEGFWEATASDCSVKPKYAPVVWNGHPGLDGNSDSVDFVNVLGGGVPTTNINFALPKGGTIKVKVIDAVTHKPIANATACPDAASTDTGGHIYQNGFCASTNSKGAVTLAAIAPGATKLNVWADGHDSQWYDGQSDFSTATVLTVASGTTQKVTVSLQPTVGT